MKSIKNKNFIQFLGTGAGDSFDYLVRECSKPKPNKELCALVKKYKRLGGRNIRQASSLFISPDILVDFYSEKQMGVCGIRKESIRHLLITHAHYDHFQPIGIQEFSSCLSHPLNVYGSMSIKEALDFAAAYRWDKLVENFVTNQDNSNIQVRAVGLGETFRLGEVKVTPVLSNHMIDKENLILESRAFNYVFERGKKTLFYGLDSSYILAKTFEILSKFQFDIAVFDATFGYIEIDPARSGHQNFAMLDKTIAQFHQANMFKKCYYCY